MLRFFSEHDTNPDKPKYRPPFLDHFDRKKAEAINSLVQQPLAVLLDSNDVTPVIPPLPSAPPQNTQTNEERQRYQSHLQLQLNQISAANQMGVQHMMHGGGGGIESPVAPHRAQDGMKYQRNFVDGEFEFVSLVYDSFCI